LRRRFRAIVAPGGVVTDFVRFAILGLGAGAVYALVAQGLVLVYRGSGIVNFAQGAFAMAGAYVFYELTSSGVAVIPAIVASCAVGALLGLVMQLAVMWPLRTASPITRTIATLAVFLILQAAAGLHYADQVLFVNPYLPQAVWHVGSLMIQTDRLALFGIAIALSLGLALTQRRLLIGLATSALAQNERALAADGWSPNLVASLNWAAGGALAGLAGALIAPVTGLAVTNLSLLIVPALAAALLGRFDSFGLTLVGATAIGVVQSLTTRYVHQFGASDAIPFLVIIFVLVVTGRSLPLRSHLSERLQSIGTGRIKPLPMAVSVLVAAVLMLYVFSTSWQIAFTNSFAVAIVLLSIVVLTGYAGQISLAQFTMAGIGAYIAGRLVAADGWPDWVAWLAAVGAAVPIGALFALPALRTRGVNLAVVTFGLAVAVQRMLFENIDYNGGINGTNVGAAHLFGVDVNPVTHPGRYGVVALVCLGLVMVLVGNLRRSATGRRLIAIRTNERAAASLGISLVGGKLYAFCVAAAIAALGGILIAFQSPAIVLDPFNAVGSVTTTSYAVIGGTGYVAGPLFGANLAPGAVGTLFNPLFSGIANWLGVIGGTLVLLTLLSAPDGLVPVNMRAARRIVAWLRRAIGQGPSPTEIPPDDRRESLVGRAATRERVAPRALELHELSVAYGGVVAVDRVSLGVKPGEIVGLIGPNGAGKTSLIDAATGFTRPSSGTVLLGGRDITRLPPHRRVHEGLVRSWQSLELFGAVSVLENLQIASDRVGRVDALLSLVRPGEAALTPAAAAAVSEFELTEHLMESPGDLPYGRQRLLAIARSTAINPSLLLLDEPAAGLGDAESAELARLVRRLADDWGIGILVVEHDMTFVMSICDRVVVLDFGRKIAEGTPDQVCNDPVVVAAYLGDDATAAAPTGSPPGVPELARRPVE
jgi:ABC-type branched-subunit amino acid transport system ATPase component/branched-subunit amino acid ABC-type transport system permease component